jgi:hypothetical protein
MWKALITGVLLAATAAVEQSPVGRVGPTGDPDQIVCISERETGSRLAARRVCRTRREWDEHRSETRRVVEKVQSYKPTH